MSPRQRHRPQSVPWLEHRTGFPSEAERAEIVRRRQALLSELGELTIMRRGPDDPAGRKLIERYGQAEVDRAAGIIEESFDRFDFIADAARVYREYRHRFARFGGGRPFLRKAELERLQGEHARLFFERTQSAPSKTPGARERELDDLFLVEWLLWEDITAPDVPARTEGFGAPPARIYTSDLVEVLGWGVDLNLDRIAAAGDTPDRWRKHIPALIHMVLDPGLLGGWPGESPAWAPWHAVQLLGVLGAWESAVSLAGLCDQPDEWLSDLLPGVWAQMGMAVEPVLWMLLDDRTASAERRGLAAEGLHLLTDEEPMLEGKLVHGFGRMLEIALPSDPTLNGYLIFILQQMEVQDEAEDAIRSAFDGERVDPEIITLADMGWDDD